MKERPILFNGEMVRAILENRKSQTRRVIKPQPGAGTDCPYHIGQGSSRKARICPHGRVGDRLIPALGPLAGYDSSYCADVHGHIWSKKSGEWKRISENESNGYLRVSLRKDGHDSTALVHRLVASAFYGEHVGMVRHLDGDRKNNVPENLDWGTHEQNWADRKIHRAGINEAHHAAKLDWEKVRGIRSSGKTAWALSKELGLSSRTIDRVLKNQTWCESYEKSPPNHTRWASRITLEITNVRVERLQEISEEDAEAEGIDFMRRYPDSDPSFKAKMLFEGLWDSVAKPEHSWKANPWVWVIEFKRIEV